MEDSEYVSKYNIDKQKDRIIVDYSQPSSNDTVLQLIHYEHDSNSFQFDSNQIQDQSIKWGNITNDDSLNNALLPFGVFANEDFVSIQNKGIEVD
ncbi:hypothetical protein L2E82_35426 [Cichorium intybus]|uniref:Uncharacterized protein n=1 Tax=Cichorium intybus TaxID=13427 RepID=A0ACB9BNS2_CICIN|nr:hypothetical protein L2E82_35426 [Cichorium intybus]